MYDRALEGWYGSINICMISFVTRGGLTLHALRRCPAMPGERRMQAHPLMLRLTRVAASETAPWATPEGDSNRPPPLRRVWDPPPQRGTATAERAGAGARSGDQPAATQTPTKTKAAVVPVQAAARGAGSEPPAMPQVAPPADTPVVTPAVTPSVTQSASQSVVPSEEQRKPRRSKGASASRCAAANAESSSTVPSATVPSATIPSATIPSATAAPTAPATTQRSRKDRDGERRGERGGLLALPLGEADQLAVQLRVLRAALANQQQQAAADRWSP